MVSFAPPQDRGGYMESKMKTVAVLLAPGFEEGEAIVTIDILRRLKINVRTLSCVDTRAVVSYHDIPMVADATLSECFDEPLTQLCSPVARKAVSF